MTDREGGHILATAENETQSQEEPPPRYVLKIRQIVPLLIVALLVARTASAEQGILLLAHGGSEEWNARVTELAAKVGAARPTEIAFGMATRASIQGAVDRLVARGVSEIVAVPLFVSS